MALATLQQWSTSVPYSIHIAVICGALGIYVGYKFATIGTREICNSTLYEDGDGEYKMVILVRSDLNMGKGKAAAQCCHAVLEAYKEALRRYPKVLSNWERRGQPKVTLKVENEREMDELIKKARSLGLCAQSIRDAGRTQVASGTKTVAAIGPGPIKMIDLITGHLKLY